MTSNFTGERLLTSVYNNSTINHLHRYAIALNLIVDKTVLDIASGEGYGSFLLSNKSKFVYGVDIDLETVENAKLKYKRANLQFLEGSTSAIPLKSNCVDVVVSFETIEHHAEHEEMMIEIKRVLKPDGVLLISTPDKYFYSDLRHYNNQFHVKELYKQQFEDLLSKYFKETQLLSQSYFNENSIIVEDSRRNELEFYTGSFLKLSTTSSPPHFLIAQCSDFKLIGLKDSIFEGKQLIESNRFQKQVKAIYDSHSYRLGSFILSPIKIMRRLIKLYKK